MFVGVGSHEIPMRRCRANVRSRFLLLCEAGGGFAGEACDFGVYNLCLLLSVGLKKKL